MNPTSQTIFNEIIIKINNNSLQLASLPDLIIKVNTVLADERKGISDIAKVIQSEISLSTRIIRIANSPGLRGDREITSISDAIGRLGLTLVKNLAIVVSLSDKFKTKNVVHSNLMETLTDASIESSVYGYMMTKFLAPSLSPEMALINGLISNLGHMVVLRYMNDTDAYKTYNQEDTCRVVTEIGNNVGSALLMKWAFPTSCIDAIFGGVSSNRVHLRTYRDVFVMTQRYVEYKANPKVEHFETFYLMDAVIERNYEEYMSLLLVIS